MIPTVPTSPPKYRHPKGLYLIFAVEMWERFGYYTLLALLSLYLKNHLHIPESETAGFYGTFISLVYFTPLIFGFIADHFLGYRRSVLVGSILLAVGYLALGLHAKYQARVDVGMYAILGIIIVGNGFFKPSMGTLVGNLYAQGDPNRDAGFGIFYMGVNIGAFFAPIVAGILRRELGWHWAFASAGFGMMVGFLLFAMMNRRFLAAADQKSGVAAVTQVALPSQFQDPPLPLNVTIRRIAAVCILVVGVIIFWMAFHQNGSTLTFWAQNNTILSTRLGGLLKKPFEIGPELFQSVNPFFIITLSPLLVLLHKKLRQKNREPSTPVKIVFGMLITAGSFLVLVLASFAGGDVGRVSPLWLIGYYFFATIGELYLSPMGTSLVTKLSPPKLTSMLLGLWYCATALGNKLVGTTGERFWSKWPHHQFWLMLSLACVVSSVFLVFFVPFLKRTIPKEGQK